MPGIALRPGEGGLLLEGDSFAAGSHNSLDFWLLKTGGAIVTLDITDIGTGQVDAVTIQAKNGDNYDDIFVFDTLAYNANGRYRFRIAPGTSAAGSWAGARDDIMPPTGRVVVVNSVGAVEFQVSLEALEN